MNCIKRPKDITVKDELPRSVRAQYATGEEQRNSSRKWWHGNEAMGKVCGNCPSCLFPAALVSSGLSLYMWAGPALRELPLELG